MNDKSLIDKYYENGGTLKGHDIPNSKQRLYIFVEEEAMDLSAFKVEIQKTIVPI